jgi:phage/plasmid-like protein (TIGR03299 family)
LSTETTEWLNRNVLIGFTEQRGQAWHYRASAQGDEPNHYAGAIPVEDVRRRLFSWQAEAMPMFIQPEGRDPVEVPNRVAIVRNDTYEVLGVPSTSYAPHQYEEALLRWVEGILDDNLRIGSAGLLKNGAVAWVQVEVAENREVAGVAYRPHLLATTSFNGSIATTYKRTVTIVVCDNTRAMALSGEGEAYRVRHTAKSRALIGDARQALAVIFDLGDAFEREVKQLLDIKVTDEQYQTFVAKMLPLREDPSNQAKTRNERMTAQYLSLWADDPRVAPWRNTAFGALQAANTYRQHLREARGETIRAERNMMDVLTGATEAADKRALELVLTASR